MKRAAELWRRHWPAFAVLLLALAAALPLLSAPRAPRGAPRQWPRGGRAAPCARSRSARSSSVLRRAFRARSRASPMASACWCCAASASRRACCIRPPIVFRGLGWRIQHTQLERDAQQRLWRCFEAEGRDGQRLRVCERIAADDDGSAFVDASSWFWAAALGQSKGPWQAVTVVEAM